MKPTFLIDCDGTLYRGNEPIPFASEFISFLNNNNYMYFLTTNCPLHSAKEISEKLFNIGINVNKEKIITSGTVTAFLLSSEYNIHSAYILGSEALKQEFEKNHINLDAKQPEAVVIGFDPDIGYQDIATAVQFVHKGAKLFSTNEDNTIPDGNNIIPHTGAISACVEYACNVKAISFGKPENHMFKYLQNNNSISKENTIVIGDRLDTDIAFANNCGLSSILVNDELKVQCTDCQPTFVFNNLNEVINMYKHH